LYNLILIHAASGDEGYGKHLPFDISLPGIPYPYEKKEQAVLSKGTGQGLTINGT
jgi:hypothetical protein